MAIEIISPTDIDPEIIILPPLFIQPLDANALIHGLHPRQACGTIVVEFLAAHKEILSCSITDDGIGRKQSATAIQNVPSTNKSSGIAITRKRTAAFYKAFGRVPIGRASWRERVCKTGYITVVSVSLKKIHTNTILQPYHVYYDY